MSAPCFLRQVAVAAAGEATGKSEGSVGYWLVRQNES
jgi:hypothetical protein